MSGAAPDPVPDVVTLQVWRWPVRTVAAAVTALGAASRRGGPGFVKLLGTSTAAFVPWRPTPTRWALLTAGRPTIDTSRWDRRAVEAATLALRPTSVRGRWNGRVPFAARADQLPVEDAGATAAAAPVLALTRATLRPRTAVRFYRAVPAVAGEVRAADGCRLAFGIGEAPLLRQGTLSLWESAAALRAFVHGRPAHRRAVRDTPAIGWYAEEMFAHFAVVDARGTIDGISLR